MNGLEQSKHQCSHTSKTTLQNRLLNKYLLPCSTKNVEVHHRQNKGSSAVRYCNNSPENHNTQCYQKMNSEELNQGGANQENGWNLNTMLLHHVFLPTRCYLNCNAFYFPQKDGFSFWKKPSHQNLSRGDQSPILSENTVTACSTATTLQLSHMFPYCRNKQ